MKPFPFVCYKRWQGWPQRWTRIAKMLAPLLTLCLKKITQKIVIGNAAWWDLLDIFVISVTQENIYDLTLSLPESLMEFCKVNVTFESAVKMLCCGHLHRMLFLFQNFTKGNLEIWSKLAFAKFGTNHIIDQKQQHPCDIASFSTSDKPVHPVMSKTKKQTKPKKNDFENFTYITSIAVVHNLLKRRNKPRIHRISIPE